MAGHLNLLAYTDVVRAYPPRKPWLLQVEIVPQLSGQLEICALDRPHDQSPEQEVPSHHRLQPEQNGPELPERHPGPACLEDLRAAQYEHHLG